MSGQVILVGAGPGDPGLLTLKGRQALEEANHFGNRTQTIPGL